MTSFVQKTLTLDETDAFAVEFASQLQSGDVICLKGSLGAGKTTFLFSLLNHLGLRMDQGFASPTFTILNQYSLPDFEVNHLDLYRLSSFDELQELDILTFFSGSKSLTFIEWGNKFSELEELYSHQLSFDYPESGVDYRIVSWDKKQRDIA